MHSDCSFLDVGSGSPCLPGLVVVVQGLEERLVQEAGVDDGGADYVWVDVGGGSSVLNVALAVGSGGGGGDSD